MLNDKPLKGITNFEDSSMDEFWIVSSVFFFFNLSLFIIVYALHSYKVKRLDTMLKLAESSGEVKPEMIAMLGSGGGPTDDLRKGLIWLALGVPLAIGLAIEAGAGPAAFGCAPILIGFAYLAVMKFGYQDDKSYVSSSPL